ncbi:hypothetical protein [Pseudomonas sp. LT1P18]|uniref:hypothetical protein n=1 Tax=Pseudomonas arabinosi TaxID=3398357 RepID=UPI0039EF4538
MSYKQLYEIKDIEADGSPEVVMSRYNEGNNDLSHPNFSITISSSNKDGIFDTTTGPEDVDGDGDRDEEDESYYTVAAKLVSAMVSLSSVGDRKVFDRILLLFKDAIETDVSILHFRLGNTDLQNPDFTVTATNPDTFGSYRTIKDAIDADGDEDVDKDDELIYRKIATSFASMRDLQS